MTAKNREAENEEKEDFEEKRTGAAFEDVIRHFIEEGGRRQATPAQWIYKYVDDKSGQERIQKGHFRGEELKDPHQIGILYGAGRYGVRLDLPKGMADEKKEKYHTFRLGEEYNELKQKADIEKRRTEALERGLDPAAMAVIAAPAAPAAADTFNMVKDILSLILPVIQANNAAAIPPAAAPAPSPGDLLNQYALMQNFLKKNLFDTAETFREYSRRYAIPTGQEIEQDETEPEEKEPSLMEKIISLIEPFFSLIANKSPAAQMAAQGLRSAPQFLEVLNDPALCRMIVQHFDRTKGRAASDIALKNIGINRAQLFAPPAAAQTAPARSPAATGSPTPRQNTPRATPAAGKGANGQKTALKPRRTAETAAA